MINEICVIGYPLTVPVAVFVFAYFDKVCHPDGQTDRCICVVLALIWPAVLLILLGSAVIDVPFALADRYARKHNEKHKHK